MDWRAILCCAESFQEAGSRLVDTIRELPEDSSADAPEGLGVVVSSATNIGFAVELYLKALLVQSGLSVPKSHDLSKLHGCLPPDSQARIEQLYVTRCHSLPPDERHGFTIAKGPITRPQLPVNDYSLRSLLDRSRDIFASWRYVFEFSPAPHSDYQFHHFDYMPLLCLCEAIRAEIKD